MLRYHWGSAALIPQEGRGLHCTRAGAAGSRSHPAMCTGWKWEQGNLIKPVGKRLDFTERQSQTMASEIHSSKCWGWKPGKSCLGSPSAVLPCWGECREQSLYVIHPLHTELSQRPARPASTKDLSAAEWEHCASAAAVRNQVCSQQPSAAALFWQGALKSLTPLVACRPLYLSSPCREGFSPRCVLQEAGRKGTS